MSRIKEDQLKRFRGVWPALITPIDAEGKPNLRALEKLIELLIAQNLDGLYVLGSTGQGILLTESQRKTIAEVVWTVVNKRIPVMVQVGAMTTAESMRLARHAEQIGVDAISAVGPIYYSATNGSGQMALRHYRSIAESTHLPFFPYQLGRNNFNEGIPLFVEKLLEIPNVAGMKLTTNNLLEISTFYITARNSLRLFSGSDELMCHAALCGASGAIGSMYNLWGQECKKVREDFLKGDIELAIVFMLAFQEVILSVLPNIWSFLHHAIKLRYGIDVGMPMAPLGNTNRPWTDSEIIALTSKVTEASKLQSTSV